MDHANSKMEDSLSSVIAQADALALNAAIMAVTARYKVLYPQWELMAISVHTDPKNARRTCAVFGNFGKRTGCAEHAVGGVENGKTYREKTVKIHNCGGEDVVIL